MRGSTKIPMKCSQNYMGPHTDIYWSDLSLGVGSSPMESDPATWQKPNEWPLCEKADWFSLLCFLHFLHHLLQKRRLVAAELELITHLWTGWHWSGFWNSFGIGWTTGRIRKVPVWVIWQEGIKKLFVSPSTLLGHNFLFNTLWWHFIIL